MNLDQYQAACERTESRVSELSEQQIRLVHGLLGCASEVGELADNLKRHLFYGQELDRANIVEEIGDVLWYLALLANATDQSLQGAADANIRKLKTRFPEKFTNQNAAEENRDRGAETKSMAGFRIKCPGCGVDGPISTEATVGHCIYCGKTWTCPDTPKPHCCIPGSQLNPADIEDELSVPNGDSYRGHSFSRLLNDFGRLTEFSRVVVDLLDGQDHKRMSAKLDEILNGVENNA